MYNNYAICLVLWTVKMQFEIWQTWTIKHHLNLMCQDYSYTNIHHSLKPGTHSHVQTNLTNVRPGRWQHYSKLGLLVESLKLYPLSHHAVITCLDMNNLDNFNCTVLLTCHNIIYHRQLT